MGDMSKVIREGWPFLYFYNAEVLDLFNAFSDMWNFLTQKC